MTTTSPATPMVADSAAEFVADPTRFASISGVPDEVARRIPGWASLGIDVGPIVEVIRARGLRPGAADWVAAFTRAGDRQAASARITEGAGSSAPAAAAWLGASFSYFLARWPSPAPNRPDAWDAYARHTAAYLAAARHFPYPFEVVTVPFDETEVVAYMHHCAVGRVPRPLALVCGGIDVWTVDIPGTGQSPVRPGPGAVRVFTVVIDHLLAGGGVAPHIGVVGLSF